MGGGPAEGPPPPWGPGVRGEYWDVDTPKRLYKAPTDKRKPRQTKESADRLYKAPARLYKAPEDFTKPRKII